MRCRICGKYRPLVCFSASQIRKGRKRRCRACVKLFVVRPIRHRASFVIPLDAILRRHRFPSVAVWSVVRFLDNMPPLSVRFFRRVSGDQHHVATRSEFTSEMLHIYHTTLFGEPVCVKYGRSPQCQREYEVRLQARLQPHPNVVSCYAVLVDKDAEGTSDILGLVMSYRPLSCALNSLWRHKWAAQLDPRDKLAICEQLCRGLAYLHEHRILHHDLDLSNLLLDPWLVVQICDLGVAEVVDETTGHADPRRRSYGHSYLAPEQDADSTEPITLAFDRVGLQKGISWILRLGTPLSHMTRWEIMVRTVVCDRKDTPPHKRGNALELADMFRVIRTPDIYEKHLQHQQALVACY